MSKIGAASQGRQSKRAVKPRARAEGSSSELGPLDSRSATADRRTEILRTADRVIARTGLRTSLQQIADEAGILAGSLYHHFESKEALLVELVRRYHADLDKVGETALERFDDADPRPVPEQLEELGRSIARTAVENRAALQISFYELPSADPELVKLTHRRPTAIQEAILQVLRAGRWSGYIKPDIDLAILADRFCQTMLHVGLDVIRHNASSDQVATMLSHIILQGLATKPPRDASLDRSTALAAAHDVIDAWSADDELDDRAAHIRAVARAEFGRRGYEATTIRDVAAAGGWGTGTVYRLIGSKEELLSSIMKSFGKKVGAGWTAVLTADATAVEKLDALSWVNINALNQYPDEFRIQLAWLRQSPPDVTNPGWSFSTRVRQMKALLSEGIRAGDITVDSPNAEIMARCVIGVQWIPENILAELGTRRALMHVRDTVLRGVAHRKPSRRR